jgi:hypothetical protein
LRKADIVSMITRLKRTRARENQGNQEAQPPVRTIVVTARVGSRLSRLRVRQPAVAAERPYDADLAAELIRNTGQYPENKGDLIVVLGAYRQALYDLVTSPDAAAGSRTRP